MALQLGAPSLLLASAEATESRDYALHETVKVELIQLEVTAWPKEPGSDACLGLTAADFELLVDGKPHPIYAVDALSAEQNVLLAEAPAAADAVSGGTAFVLLFDLWHLDVFYADFDACPRTKPLAFAEARRLVREEFHRGDRLLLVTFAGWPIVHYDWIRTPAEAIEALDRLERSRQVMASRQEHVNHNYWIEGMESLFLALGNYPGRKEVFYLADDFRFDEVTVRLNEIAGRAQANGVVVNAVDLLDSCRRVPGPGNCRLLTGGLGCTEFAQPLAIAQFAEPTGGRLFRTDRIAAAVHDLRSARSCRYVVSFQQQSRKRKGPPVVRLRLRGGRKDLTLLAPASFELGNKAPTRREKDESLFLLPRFGRGIGAEVGLWPYRPSGKRGRWKAFVLAEVERTDDEPWPEELTSVSLNVLVHRDSRLYMQTHKTIEGEELANLRSGVRQKLMFFPVEELRPGEATVELTVTGSVEAISANLRRSFTVPEPPRSGEARAWFVSDRVARFGEDSLPVPSLDNVVNPGEPISFLAFGCNGQTGLDQAYSGRLVPFAGGPSVAVPVAWLHGFARLRGGCGWLVGRTAAPLEPGLWTFEPPSNLGRVEATSRVEFSVSASDGSEMLPAEVRPH